MEGILGEMIPIAGIVMIVLIVWLRSHYAALDRRRLHETVRLMVEKGQPVSSEMLSSLNSSPNIPYRDPGRNGSAADIRRGITWIAVALAMAVLGFALFEVTDFGRFFIGLAAFPGFIGLGFVVIGLLNRGKQPKA